MSNIVKSKFVGLLRGLLRRYDDSDAASVVPDYSITAPPPNAAPRPSYLQGSVQRASSRPPAFQPKPQPVYTPPPAAPAVSPDVLQLPLPSIVAALPMELRAKMMRTPPEDASVSVPVETVLSQLANGSVKITFGELRAALPGLFLHAGSENDARQITLPLKEIISRINPILLSRRAAKKVDLAEDIAGPFRALAQTVASTPAPAAPIVPATPLPAPTPKVPKPLPAQAAPTSARKTIPFVATNGAAAHRPAPTAPAASVQTPPAADTFNFAPLIPVDDSILAPLSALAEKWPEAIKQEIAQAGLTNAQAALPITLVEPGLKNGRVTITWKNLRPMIRPKSALPSTHDGMELVLPLKVLAPLFFARQKAAGKTKQSVPTSDEIPDLFFGSSRAETATPSAPVEAFVPAPVPAAPIEPPTPAAPEQKTILAPLAELLEKWPEALRQEIANSNLSNAQVALPLDLVSPAVKRGVVRFVWRQLRSWLRPTPATIASVHDDVELELPLKIIAPLFLQHQAPATRRHLEHGVDQSIPNFFFDIPSLDMGTQVNTPVPPALEPARRVIKPADARMSETNFYVWGDTNDAPKVDVSQFKRSQTPGTDFTSRYATPKEVVEHAMQVPGVAGAVVALYDGLLIASQVPPELNADTVAAFLPQIFSRTSQSTKELRMGELNNLNFTVGNVPWVIFCVSSVYFAAFGPADGTLPVPTLMALARRLDRRSK